MFMIPKAHDEDMSMRKPAIAMTTFPFVWELLCITYSAVDSKAVEKKSIFDTYVYRACIQVSPIENSNSNCKSP